MRTPVRKPHARPVVRRAIILLCVAFLLAACIMLPRKRIDVSLSSSAPLEGTWAVNTIEVDHRTLADQIRRQLTDLLLPSFRAHGLPLTDGAVENADAAFLVDIRLTEREITRDLDAVNALSVTVVVREKGSDRQAATVLYSEESKESFASPYHLHAVMDDVLDALARKALQAPRKR
jgi:hypothetical protein